MKINFTEEKKLCDIRTCIDIRELVKENIEPDSLYIENTEAIMSSAQKYRFVDYNSSNTIDDHIKTIVGSSLFSVALLTFEITSEMEREGIATDVPVSDYDTALDIFERKLHSGVFDKSELEKAINAVKRIYKLAETITDKNQELKKQIHLEILEIYNSAFKSIDEWNFNIEVSYSFSDFYKKTCNKIEKYFGTEYSMKIRKIAEKPEFDYNDKDIILNLLMDLSKAECT